MATYTQFIPNDFDPGQPWDWCNAITNAAAAAMGEADKGMYADPEKYDGYLLAAGQLAKKAMDAHRAMKKGEKPEHPLPTAPEPSAPKQEAVKKGDADVGGKAKK